MKRNTFIKLSGMASTAMAFPLKDFWAEQPTHLLTLSFDDGFKKSFKRIARIHEEHGLRACLNVIATGHLKSFEAPGPWIGGSPLGDFELWNQLQEDGHEVMPHSWKHTNLKNVSQEEAQDLILKCMDYFQENLMNFDQTNSVFNFPYNASTPEIEEWLKPQVRAFRGWGKERINPWPTKDTQKLGCITQGPDNLDDWLENQINDFLKTSGGWLIINAHGLNKEGWGPMSTSFLDDLLKRLTQLDYLEILPAGEVMQKYATD